MKILVTGGKGMLAQELGKVLEKTEHEFTLVGREELDVSDEEAVKKYFEANKFDSVVNCAARIDVDWCEMNPNESNMVNFGGAANLAQYFKGHLIQISTSSVFGEYGALWPEIDFTDKRPMSVYSRNKDQAEYFIQHNAAEWTIIRSGWLFSGDANDTKFVRKVYEKLVANEPIKAVSDISGQLIYAPIMAEFIVRVIDEGLRGFFHVASPNSCSRLEIVSHLCSMMGLGRFDRKIENVRNVEFDLPAPRPNREFLRVDRTEQISRMKFPSWPDMLARAYEERMK